MSTSSLPRTYRAEDVAEELQCSPRHVRNKAREHGIGANLGGRAGWRFTEEDVAALLKAMTPVKPPVVRRQRRTA